MGQDGSVSARPLPIPLALFATAAGMVAMIAISALAGRSLMASVGIRGLLLVAEAALVAPGMLLLAGLRRDSWRGTLALDVYGRSIVFLGAILGATLWLASLGLLELQYTVWRPPLAYIEGFRHLHEMLRPKGAVDALWSLLAIAVAPAVCEEASIRGLLLPSLRTRLPAAVAVALSAVAFALMHDLYRMPFTCAVGLVLGALRLRTGSLVPSLLAHASLNTLTFVAAPFLDDPSQPLPDPRPLLGLGLLAFGTVGTLLAWRRLPLRPLIAPVQA